MAKKTKSERPDEVGTTRVRGRSVEINVEYLERLRTDQGLAQQDLAEQAGVSLRGYGRIRATGRTSFYTRGDLATILGVSPKTLSMLPISVADDYLHPKSILSEEFVRPVKAESTLYLLPSQVAELAGTKALSLISAFPKGAIECERRFHFIRTTSLPAAITDWTAMALRNSMPKLEIQDGQSLVADTAVCLNSALGGLTIASSFQGNGLFRVAIGRLNIAAIGETETNNRCYSGDNVEVLFTHDFAETLNKCHTDVNAFLFSVHAFVSTAVREFNNALVKFVLDEALRTQSDTSYILYEEMTEILKKRRLGTEVSLFAWDVRCGGRSMATPEILKRAFSRISSAARQLEISPIEFFSRFYSSFLRKEDLFPLDDLGTKVDLREAKYDGTFQFAEQIILQGHICRGQVLCRSDNIVIEAWYPDEGSVGTALAFAEADKLKLRRALKKESRTLSELFCGNSGVQ